MRWEFSDGTVATLGGDIEGPSQFAQELRAELEHDDVGVQLYPGPGGGVALDRNDPALFDAWLRQEADRPFHGALRMTSRPDDIPELPPDPRDFEGLSEDTVW